MHVDDERRDALVPRRIRVGARQQQAPVGDVGVARPDLVTVDDVVVAVASRLGPQRRQVRAGARLREALAPPLGPVDHAGQESLLEFLAAMLPEADDEIPQARPGRCARAGQFFVDDHVVDRWEFLSADTSSATTSRRTRPSTAPGATPPAAPSSRRPTWRTLPPARSTRTGGVSRNAASSGESRKSKIDLLQADREQLGRRQCTPQVHVSQAFPGVSDPAVHLDGGLAHRPRGSRAVHLRDVRRAYRLSRLVARRPPRPHAEAR